MKKTFICVNFYTAYEKLCEYENFLGEKSKNQDELIQSGTLGQHFKNWDCPRKTRTVRMFGWQKFVLAVSEKKQFTSFLCNRFLKNYAKLISLFSKKLQAYRCFPATLLKIQEFSCEFCKTFKACVHHFLTNIYFSLNHTPSKTMKDIFYFI